MIRRLRADSRGFAFSLDVLLALIPLTIILGMAVANMDNIMYLSENTIFQSSLDRTAADVADALVETPGVPNDWQMSGSVSTAGLASYDSYKNITQKNVLDASKVASMNSTLLDNLLGTNYGGYLVITIVNSTDSRVIKTVGTYNNSASNIVKVTRFVTGSNMKSVISLEGLIRDAGQPKTYTASFPTSDYYLQIYDYWIYIVNKGYDSATVDVNSTTVISSNQINQHITEIKEQIDPSILANGTSLTYNVVNVRTVSNPGASMDVYVIAVPKGTSQSEINLENIKIRDAKLELYVWTR